MLRSWAAPVGIVLMGVALLVTAWLTYAGVNDATATVSAGEASVLRQGIRLRMMEKPEQALERAVSELGGDGLRYVAMLDDHNVPMSQAGTRSALPLPEGPPGEPITVGDRLRVTFPASIAGPEPRRRGQLVIEFVPRRANELRAVARRTLLAGVAAAAGLLGVAFFLIRLAMRREAALRELERARHLAGLGEMSAVLAHEIRNPLASLKGNAQLLAAALPAGEKSRAKAELVVEEAIRLELLTRDLLTFARTGELHLSEVDPVKPLTDAVAELHAPVTCDTSAAPRSWRLDGDRTREVLSNLVANALAAGGPVTARVATDGDELLYEVRDHGPGVAPEDKDRIFQPFFTTRTRGTGLGLAVVRRVVELHRGRVQVDAAPGGGALFTVRLPAGA